MPKRSRSDLRNILFAGIHAGINRREIARDTGTVRAEIDAGAHGYAIPVRGAEKVYDPASGCVGGRMPIEAAIADNDAFLQQEGRKRERSGRGE